MAAARKRARSCNGFTLVEVLVATLIMVISIVTVTAALRQFAVHCEKQKSYERIYTTALSLRDQIMNATLRDNASESGTLNGVPYSYQSRKVESANNYVVGAEPELSGNKGAFNLTLFKVGMEIEGRSFEFYKTQYKKVSEARADES